jgi:hypothetical protein
VDLLTDPGIDGVARVGRAGDWAFAVEYGDAAGCTEAGLRAVSRDGAEAINFLMTPWNPPSMFAHYEDGIHICSFGIGEETRRWGGSPTCWFRPWRRSARLRARAAAQPHDDDDGEQHRHVDGHDHVPGPPVRPQLPCEHRTFTPVFLCSAK